MSNKATISRLMLLVAEYGLEGKMLVESYTFAELAKFFNGMGPEWFPAWAREVLDKIFDVFAPAFLIHDTEWATTEGSYREFLNSNDRLERNCKKIADAEYGWYNPMRYYRRHQGAVFARLCQTFGYGAFKAAAKEAEKRRRG